MWGGLAAAESAAEASRHFGRRATDPQMRSPRQPASLVDTHTRPPHCKAMYSPRPQRAATGRSQRLLNGKWQSYKGGPSDDPLQWSRLAVASRDNLSVKTSVASSGRQGELQQIWPPELATGNACGS